MNRLLLAGMALVIAGCGGSSSGSYTSKALDEFRAGNGYDWAAKGKTPGAKDIAAVERKVKSVSAGTKKDFYQALKILSDHRDHDDQIFNTVTTSHYLRTSYMRVFGEPSSSNTREEPNSWTHRCTDGSVTLRGFLKLKTEPGTIKTFPHKPKQ